MKLNNLVCISDLHCGDQMGICLPKFTLTGGGTYSYSRFQKQIWKCWQSFWENWVPMATKGEPYGVLINGDAIEGRHHRATHAISQKLSDHYKIAYEILAPVAEKAAALYYVYGTFAHVGEDGENEEMLAGSLGAIPDEGGNYARPELYIEIGDVLVHSSHHIGVTGSMAYETTALTKEYNEFCGESARWGKRSPDILVRSHRHRHSEVRVPTANGYGIIFVTAAWQLKTPWLFRTPGGRITTPTIGGSLIRQGDEEAFTRHKTWEMPRSKTEKPKI